MAGRWGRPWRWPKAPGESAADGWGGWCHGSAGFAQLWSLAAGRDRRFLEAAVGAAEDVWATDDRVPDLCCGAAGRGYALLSVYRHTGDPIWLLRARTVAGGAAAEGSMYAEHSLFKGSLGVALLAVEAAAPKWSRMPLME